MQTKIRAEQTNLIDTIYPVGSIYMSVSSTNPGTTFGVGTWTAWGAGRVPVGVAGSGTFNTVEKTGGAETHTLTIAEMPLHEHVNGASTGTLVQYVGTGGNTTWRFGDGGTAAQQRDLEAVGGGDAHNNLQPFITCYMWKRTA